VRVAVLGAGAIGGLFGARLAAHGATVLLVARPREVSVLATRGITVEGVDPGRWPVEAAVDLGRSFDPDLVLLTVKTFDLDAAASELARHRSRRSSRRTAWASNPASRRRSGGRDGRTPGPCSSARSTRSPRRCSRPESSANRGAGS
jgi:Ketopantoate reductase PanE/ApbA